MTKLIPNILTVIVVIFYSVYSLAFVVPPPPRVQDPHDTREIGEYYGYELVTHPIVRPEENKQHKDSSYDQ
ncbi:MAG: hypothetical protein RCG15_08720 [Candidatus Rickettsia vulgarisii]